MSYLTSWVDIQKFKDAKQLVIIDTSCWSVNLEIACEVRAFMSISNHNTPLAPIVTKN